MVIFRVSDWNLLPNIKCINFPGLQIIANAHFVSCPNAVSKGQKDWLKLRPSLSETFHILKGIFAYFNSDFTIEPKRKQTKRVLRKIYYFRKIMK